MDTAILPSNNRLVSKALKATTDALEVAQIVFLASQIVKGHAPCLEIISPHLKEVVRQLGFWLENYTLEPTTANFDKLQANVRLFNAMHHFSAFEAEYEAAMRKVSYLTEVA